jgi:RHS repeat-associated protein
MACRGKTTSIVGVETYSYDFESHMTQREASGGSTDTHEYDGDGRRMRSKLDDAADWTHFIHDELTENLICEYTLISGTFTIKALNTYGLGLISSNRQGTIRYFHFDGLGTTQHLTDSTQAVTDSYTYDACGVPTSATGSSTNPYRYVGQWGYYDDGAMGSSSEMLLLGVRYYWPKYGRFSVWDVIPQSNLYDYVNNKATIATDPDGRLLAVLALVVLALVVSGCSATTAPGLQEASRWARRPCPDAPACNKMCNAFRNQETPQNYHDRCAECCGDVASPRDSRLCLTACLGEGRPGACICSWELIDRVYHVGGPYFA